MPRLTLLLLTTLVLAACGGAKPSKVALAPSPPAVEQTYQVGRAAYEAGVALERTGRFAEATLRFNEAAEHFARVVQADPQHLHALINWGSALSRGGKPAEAITKFQQALEQNPNKAEAYYNWGVALERMGDHMEAVRRYEQALALKADILTPELQRYLERYRPLEQDTRIKSTLPRAAPTPRR
jgi:tetratricopeptide (TPR) repeat protein